MTDDEHPLLAVDLYAEPGRTFRVPPHWYVDVSAVDGVGDGHSGHSGARPARACGSVHPDRGQGIRAGHGESIDETGDLGRKPPGRTHSARPAARPDVGQAASAECARATSGGILPG